jgi:hypothetical protein
MPTQRGAVRFVSSKGGVQQRQVFTKNGAWINQNAPKGGGAGNKKKKNKTSSGASTNTSMVMEQRLAAEERKAYMSTTASAMMPGGLRGNINNYGKYRASGMNAHALGMSSTSEGGEWLDCYLHPCMEPAPKPRGVPDRSSAMVAAPLFKSTSTQSWTLSTGSTYDMQIAFLPIPEIDYVMRQRSSSAATWTAWTVVYMPNFVANQDGTAVTMATQGYGSQRIIGRGHTVHLIASGTTNQGMVFSGQVDGLDFEEQYTSNQSSSQGIPASRYLQYRVPFDPAELMALDNAATEMEAVHGCYMPLRFTENSWVYQQPRDGVLVGYDGTGTSPTDGFLPQQWVQIVDNSALTPATVIMPNGVPTFAVPSEAPTVGSKMVYGISDPTPFLTGIVFFQGIDVAASAQIKSRVYVEGQPEAATFSATGGASIRPFCEPSPLYDPQALHNAALIAQVSPHAYPAADNDFSGVMSKIFSVLKTVGGAITGVARIASGLGLPGAGTVATIGGALGL